MLCGVSTASDRTSRMGQIVLGTISMEATGTRHGNSCLAAGTVRFVGSLLVHK